MLLFHLSHESPAEALRRFRTQKERIEEGFRFNHSCRNIFPGETFSERVLDSVIDLVLVRHIYQMRTFALALQMDTIREQSTSPMGNVRELARHTGMHNEDIGIPHTSLCVIIVPQ